MSKKLVVAANRHRRTYLGRLRLTQVSCWSIFFVLVVACCWPEYFYNSLGVHRFGKDTKRISSAKSMCHMRLSTSCSHNLAYAVKESSRYIPKQTDLEHRTLKTCTLSREANIGDSRKRLTLVYLVYCAFRETIHIVPMSLVAGMVPLEVLKTRLTLQSTMWSSGSLAASSQDGATGRLSKREIDYQLAMFFTRNFVRINL